jgi:hypothetical protein
MNPVTRQAAAARAPRPDTWVTRALAVRAFAGSVVPGGLALTVPLTLAFACASSSKAGGVESPPFLAAPPGLVVAPGPVDAGAAVPGPVSSIASNAQRSQVVPPDVSAVERMCALLTSCDRLPIPSSLVPDDFATCVKKMSEDMTSATAVNFSLTIRECGLQSDSCASLRTCALHGANPDACVGRGKQGVVSFCDVDGRALTCWHDQTLAVRDCPRGGEQCLVQGGQATCSLGSCPSTIADGDKPRCSGSGTHLLHCESGKLASLDCAAFGLRCAVGPDGAAGCATNGPPCAAGSSRCDGNVAVGCFNGHEVKVECSAAGLACNQVAGAGMPVGACVASPLPSGGCDPNDRPRCDDAVIKYCASGRPRSYSCKSVGFGRCEGSKTGLHCAP